MKISYEIYLFFISRRKGGLSIFIYTNIIHLFTILGLDVPLLALEKQISQNKLWILELGQSLSMHNNDLSTKVGLDDSALLGMVAISATYWGKQFNRNDKLRLFRARKVFTHSFYDEYMSFWLNRGQSLKIMLCLISGKTMLIVMTNWNCRI